MQTPIKSIKENKVDLLWNEINTIVSFTIWCQCRMYNWYDWTARILVLSINLSVGSVLVNIGVFGWPPLLVSLNNRLICSAIISIHSIINHSSLSIILINKQFFSSKFMNRITRINTNIPMILQWKTMKIETIKIGQF